MKILVTAGGTEEPIDAVRRLTNTSTGATGTVLAQAFAAHGAEVLLLHAERARVDETPCRRETFVTFGDLEQSLKNHLGNEDFDAVVHLAAVGDYALHSIEVDGILVFPGSPGKIGSGHRLTLHLRPTPKLIDRLRGWSRNSEIVVVAFKLTDEPDDTLRRAAVDRLLDRARPDLVVHNDLSGIGPDGHEARIFDSDGEIAHIATKDQLARELWNLISERITV